MTKSLIKYPPETPEQRLIWEVWFLFIMIIVVGIFGQDAALDVTFTIIISILFGINIIIRFLTINEKGDWIFFLLGVIGGGGNDLLSMINGVYNYTSITIIPILTGLMPLWMIIFWGQVFLLFRKIFNLSWCKGEEFQKGKGLFQNKIVKSQGELGEIGNFIRNWIDKKLMFDICLIFILRSIIYNTYMLDFWIPALFYAIGVGVRFLVFPPKRNEIMIVIILPYAFIFEALMVVAGLYVYFNPLPIVLIPLWLCIWWIFLVPIFLKEIFDRVEYSLKEGKQ